MFLNLEQTRKHYRQVLQDKPSDYYERFDLDILARRPLVRELMTRAFERLFPTKAGHLLDLGCGTCFYYPLLARHAERITGVDLCVPMLEQAKVLIERERLTNCQVMESSALSLPIPDHSVDVVHSWDFLHHVQDVPRTVQEIVRVLKPGGRYVAFEPNIFNPSISWYHARRRAEWRIFAQNQLTIPRQLRRFFDVRIRYDNTIISFLNERTRPLWQVINTVTKVWPLHLLSFRYIMDSRLRDAPR